MRRGQRSTPAGQHQAVMLDEVLAVLDPQPGAVIIDCTLGWGGHAVELLRRAGPQGRLIGIDLDPENLPRARERLESTGLAFSIHHGNFAGVPTVLATEGLSGCDLLLADLGMSSMQVDDAERGFSYVRDGRLDMRMDRSRGRTAAQLLATIAERELAHALREIGDEPEAGHLAAVLVAARKRQAIERTRDLAQVIEEAAQQGKHAGGWRLHPRPGHWNLHPAARTFQTLRILVNRELANLEQLLRVLPACLRPGGKAAIISFHSGEDRRVKTTFREGFRWGQYSAIAPEPLRPTWQERTANPRARSAKLRWAQRTASGGEKSLPLGGSARVE
jgi:16S rRNA (cytosine1402-N4)-methyltransferase